MTDDAQAQADAGFTPRQLELKDAGNAALSAGDLARALGAFTEALADAGGSSEARAVLHSNRAAVSLAMNDFDEALRDANEAVRLRPSWPRAWGRKGAALFGKRDYAGAATAYREAAARCAGLSGSSVDRKRYENFAVQCEMNSAGPRSGAGATPEEYASAFPTDPSTPLALGMVRAALALRWVSVAFAAVFLASADPVAYTRSLGALFVALALDVVARADAAPEASQRYAETLLRNPNAIPAMLVLGFTSLPGNLPALASAHLAHASSTAIATHAAASGFAPSLAAAAADRVGGLVARALSLPPPPTTPPAALRSEWDTRARRWAARLEIGAFVVILVQLLTPARNFLGVLLMAQILKLRNLTSPDAAEAWRQLDARLASYAARVGAGAVYARAAQAVRAFAAPPDANSMQRGGTGLGRACAVM